MYSFNTEFHFSAKKKIRLFDDVSICEALVLISRTVALYYLITNFTGVASFNGTSLPPVISDPMN